MANDLTDLLNSVLTAIERPKYEQWRQSLPTRLRSTYDYDLPGFFKKYGAVDIVGDQHLTDEFKKPNHETFSNQSIYSNESTPGGSWMGENEDVYLPSQETLSLSVIAPLLKALTGTEY